MICFQKGFSPPWDIQPQPCDNRPPECSCFLHFSGPVHTSPGCPKVPESCLRGVSARKVLQEMLVFFSLNVVVFYNVESAPKCKNINVFFLKSIPATRIAAKHNC